MKQKLALLVVVAASLGATWSREIEPELLPGKTAIYSYDASDGTGFSSVRRHQCGTVRYGFEDGAGGNTTIQSCSDAACSVSKDEAVLVADAGGTFLPRYPWLRVSRVAVGAGTSQVYLTCGGNVAVTGAAGGGHTISDEGTPLAAETVLNFVGAGVTATAGVGETVVTIPINATAPAGADTQVQFNDAGAFGGDAQYVWNKTTNTLTVGDATTQGFLDVKCPTPGSMDCETTYVEDTFGASPAAGFRKFQAQSAGFGEKDSAGNTGRFLSTRTGSATSAEVAGTLTDETGTAGGMVRATSPSITTPTIVTYLDSAEAVAPAAPAAGVVRFYAKNSATAEFCSKDDAGTETCMSAGAGGSGLTYAEVAWAVMQGAW